jgi:hypothetical protein
MRTFRYTVSCVALASSLSIAACIDETESSSTDAVAVAHKWDLASQMPDHLAIMYSMSWFGIPASDHQGAGPDPGWGNTEWNGNNANACTTCVLRGADNVCLENGAPQRDTASRRRMIAGIYSASALDAEGKARTDLMLSQLRRPCDDGAKLDAWSVQLAGTHGSPAHPGNRQSTTGRIAYDALVGFLNQADAAGMTNVILPGDDTTWYFGFGSAIGLPNCSTTGKAACIAALEQDLVDMVDLSEAHRSGFKLAGKPLITIYIRPGDLTSAQWVSIVDNARNASGHDFYVVAMVQGVGHADYFNAFDALMPWLQQGDIWTNGSSGSTVRKHAENWAAKLHDPLFAALPSYPGRVVFGGMTPGFDDYTMSWGGHVERQLPTGDPRDPQLLLGEFDYFKAKNVKGLIGETWDDWTEGSHFEPDVVGGAALLVEMRQQLASLFGEPQDPAGDAKLSTQWSTYGQTRNCTGNTHGTPHVTDLACAGAAVAIEFPTAGSTVSNPVAVKATYSGTLPPNHFEVWRDNIKLGNVAVGAGDTMSASYTIAAGTHVLTVLAVDSDGNVIKSAPLTFTTR